MKCPHCRKRRLVEIGLTIGQNRVTMHSCTACTARWWDRDGERIPLSAVKSLATSGR